MTTVLVVDDDEGIRQLIGDVLELEGYRVIVAADGRQGLALLLTQKPDLVISDLMMPILDGVAMARAARADSRYHGVPLLALSGALTRDAVIDALFSGFLAKPFTLPTLLALVAQALSRAA